MHKSKIKPYRFNFYEQKVVRIDSAIYTAKIVVMAFLIAFGNVIQRNLDENNRFESPLVLILCIFNGVQFLHFI